MKPHALTDEVAAILRTVAVTDFCEPSTIAKVHGGSVAEQLNELHAQGLVMRQAARRPDRTRTTLYSISTSGRERLRDHEANLCVRLALKSAPAPSAGIAAPRIAHLTVAGMYDGAELRPFEGRPGAMDAFALPSRMGRRRLFRSGAVEVMERTGGPTA